jgi:prophage tail gpP-like protein
MVNKITTQINFSNYTDFKSFSLYKDIEGLSGRFHVSVSPPDNMNKFIVDIYNPNSAIVIDIDGEPIITGYIDNVEINYDTSSHEIVLSGRDKTADFIDSTLESKTFNPPIGFIALLTKLLEIVGYTVVTPLKRIGFGSVLPANNKQISIINNAGAIESFSTSEGIQLRHSESAYDLIRKMAEKRQLILSSDGQGNILIRKIGDEQALTILQNIDQEGAANNIKNGSVKIDFTQRFNQYTIKSMLNPTSNGAPFGSEESEVSNVGVAQSGSSFDDQVRSTRKYTAIGSSAMNSTDCKKRATWQANIARTKGFYYCCEVVGFRQNLNEIKSLGYAGNPLWKPNQLVYVNDNFANIDDELLIKSVTYSQDIQRGSITRLELVNKDSYSLSLFEPLLRKKVDKEITASLFGE